MTLGIIFKIKSNKTTIEIYSLNFLYLAWANLLTLEMQKVLFNAHYSETIESVLTHMVLLTSLQFLSVFFVKKVVSYRKRIARQHSRHKMFGRARGTGDPVKIFLSSSFDHHVNLVTASHTVCAHRRSRGFWGTLEPSPINGAWVHRCRLWIWDTKWTVHVTALPVEKNRSSCVLL